MTSERDLIRAAHRLAQGLQDPGKLWSVRDDPDRDVLQYARAIDRDAVAYFGEPAILAAAIPDAGVVADGRACHWCHAYQRAGQGGPLPPVNLATLRLLGESCQRCAEVNMGRVMKALDDLMADDPPAPEPEPVAAAAGPQPSVRDLIRLARRRQREREAAYTAAEEVRGA